jgi:hypothetical protein
LAKAFVEANSSEDPNLKDARTDTEQMPEARRHANLKDAQAVAKKILDDYRSGSRDARRKADLKEVQRIFRAIVEGFTGDNGQGNRRLLCMPVLLPGGPYDEDKDTRLKTRYAVLSALGVRHYKLSLGGRMSYVEIPICMEHRSIGALTQTDLAVPVKLFAKDSVHRANRQDENDYSAASTGSPGPKRENGRPRKGRPTTLLRKRRTKSRRTGHRKWITCDVSSGTWRTASSLRRNHHSARS